MPHNVTGGEGGEAWWGTFEAPLTVSYKGTLDYAAFCVEEGASCFVEPSSAIVTGQYTKPKELITFVGVGDLAPGTYSCYVATLLPKSMVCSEPETFTASSAPTPVRNTVTPQEVVVASAPAVDDAPVPAPSTDDAPVSAPSTDDAPVPVPFTADALLDTVDAPGPSVDIPEEGSVTQGVAKFTPLE